MSARRSVSCARARLSEPPDYGQPFGCLFCPLTLMQALRADRLAYCCRARLRIQNSPYAVTAFCHSAALMQALEHVRHLCRVSLNCIPESQRARAPSCRRGGQIEAVSRLIRECLGERKCEPRRPRAAFGACPPPKQGRELEGHNRNLSTRECRGFAPLELFHDISISHQSVLWGINLSTAVSAILCM